MCSALPTHSIDELWKMRLCKVTRREQELADLKVYLSAKVYLFFGVCFFRELPRADHLLLIFNLCICGPTAKHQTRQRPPEHRTLRVRSTSGLLLTLFSLLNDCKLPTDWSCD
jgi:hypothetical protein